MSAPPPEHVAAIAAAIAVVQAEQLAAARAASDSANAPVNLWVEASRRSAQRAMLQRGPWRLSGRIGRRSRT